MSGIEFLQRAKDMHPESIRILLSADADFDIISEAVNRSAIYKFVLKPYDVDPLRATIRDAFRQHESTIGNRESSRHPAG